MTKKEAIKLFKSFYAGDNFDFRRALAMDRIQVKTDWNQFTHYLCKDREITDSQYRSWVVPF